MRRALARASQEFKPPRETGTSVSAARILPPTSVIRSFLKTDFVEMTLIVISVFAVRAYAPVRPHVQVAPEAVLGPFNVPLLGEMYLTNTMISLVIVGLILLVLALAVRRAVKTGAPVLTGIAGLIETVIEALYNLAESTAGKSARRIFPWMATLILVVLVANWSKLLPGVESIGWLHEAHGGVEGYPARELFRVGKASVSAIELGGGEPAGILKLTLACWPVK
jgi:F-type H+-transporting ATPase subunit a